MTIEPELSIWPGFYEAEVGQGWDAGSKAVITSVREIRKYWNDHHLATFKNSFNCFLIKFSYFFEEPCLVNLSHLANIYNTSCMISYITVKTFFYEKVRFGIRCPAWKAYASIRWETQCDFKRAHMAEIFLWLDSDWGSSSSFLQIPDTRDLILTESASSSFYIVS